MYTVTKTPRNKSRLAYQRKGVKKWVRQNPFKKGKGKDGHKGTGKGTQD